MPKLTTEEFYSYVKDHIKMYLPSDYKSAATDLHVREKSGEISIRLLVTRKNEKLVPAQELGEYYKQYENGRPLERIMQEIAEVRLQLGENAKELKETSILDYEVAREYLEITLREPEVHEKLLKDMVYTMCGDYAATYEIVIDLPESGRQGIKVTPPLLEMWGISIKQLHEDALKRNEQQGAKLFELDDLISNLILDWPGKNLLNEPMKSMEKREKALMYCLTNEKNVHGASLILNEEILKQIGEMLEEDYWVLPSSIHEGATRFAA